MKPLLIAVISSGMVGCAGRGAPTFILFGAYFPAWMLIAIVGIIAAAAARAFMVAKGLSALVAFQLLSCTSIGVTIAVLVWVIWFAR